MGGILTQALRRAGLSELAERALQGAGLGAEDLERMRRADVLLLAGLADAVRGRFHGDEVRVLSSDAARRDPDLLRVALDIGGMDGRTGQELLVEVALARLATPGKTSVAIGVEQLGLQLGQVALTFGADVLFGDFTSSRTLPLLDGPAARRSEIGALIQRAGRTVRFEGLQAPLPMETRS